MKERLKKIMTIIEYHHQYDKMSWYQAVQEVYEKVQDFSTKDMNEIVDHLRESGRLEFKSTIFFTLPDKLPQVTDKKGLFFKHPHTGKEILTKKDFLEVAEGTDLELWVGVDKGDRFSYGEQFVCKLTVEGRL